MTVISDYINKEFGLNNLGISNASEGIGYPRHRWYYYKEGFSPNLVKTAINTYNLNSNNLILDPFNGSGTVTLTASEFNIPSIGIEVNPFTCFVSKAKELNSSSKILSDLYNKTLDKIEIGKKFTELENYSTFTETSDKNKWLFNLGVLRAFNGGYNFLQSKNSDASNLLRLALITSIMENANARKDGKCLKYKKNWQNLNYTKNTFIESYNRNFEKILLDTQESEIKKPSTIIQGDIRKSMSLINEKFDLVITSPPYLNTFDYSDIYRPELFVGKFVLNAESLYKLRLETVRSHIQANWNMPNVKNVDSIILMDIYERLNSNISQLMHKRIPAMILAYFEDMKLVFQELKLKAKPSARIWMVVSNSAYANEEIPVDLILADIASKNGWKLCEIGVLREIPKRKTRYSPDVNTLRESVIILENR